MYAVLTFLQWFPQFTLGSFLSGNWSIKGVMYPGKTNLLFFSGWFGFVSMCLVRFACKKPAERANAPIGMDILDLSSRSPSVVPQENFPFKYMSFFFTDVAAAVRVRVKCKTNL